MKAVAQLQKETILFKRFTTIGSETPLCRIQPCLFPKSRVSPEQTDLQSCKSNRSNSSTTPGLQETGRPERDTSTWESIDGDPDTTRWPRHHSAVLKPKEEMQTHIPLSRKSTSFSRASTDMLLRTDPNQACSRKGSLRMKHGRHALSFSELNYCQTAIVRRINKRM